MKRWEGVNLSMVLQSHTVGSTAKNVSVLRRTVKDTFARSTDFNILVSDDPVAENPNCKVKISLCNGATKSNSASRKSTMTQNVKPMNRISETSLQTISKATIMPGYHRRKASPNSKPHFRWSFPTSHSLRGARTFQCYWISYLILRRNSVNGSFAPLQKK